MIRNMFYIISMATLVTFAARAQSPKQVEIYGQKINYIETGSGPNVILLHGLGDDLNVWEQTVPALAPKYRVWALDQIGCGQSDKPHINYRASVFVEFLHTFCNKLGIEKAALVSAAICRNGSALRRSTARCSISWLPLRLRSRTQADRSPN